MQSSLLGSVIAGVIVAALIEFVRWLWPFIQALFDKEIRHQGQVFAGVWDTTEKFTGTNSTGQFEMELKCWGNKVKGTSKGRNGYDKDATFDLEGRFKNGILTLVWHKTGVGQLESGSLSAIYRIGKKGDLSLEGHGIYMEPKTLTLYPSTFTAKKRQ